MKPKYEINATIDGPNIIGWITDIYESRTKPGEFVYELQEPESEMFSYFHQETIDEESFN